MGEGGREGGREVREKTRHTVRQNTAFSHNTNKSFDHRLPWSLCTHKKGLQRSLLPAAVPLLHVCPEKETFDMRRPWWAGRPVRSTAGRSMHMSWPSRPPSPKLTKRANSQCTPGAFPTRREQYIPSLFSKRGRFQYEKKEHKKKLRVSHHSSPASGGRGGGSIFIS